MPRGVRRRRGRLRFAALAAVLAGLLAAGCSTVHTRAEQNRDLLASLDEKTRQTLLEGRVEPGYTMTMAYIAYGPPNETVREQTAEGESITWVYQQSYPVYHDGIFFHHDPYLRHWGYYRDPFDHGYFHDYYYQARDYLRVKFVNGRVTSIEEIAW